MICGEGRRGGLFITLYFINIWVSGAELQVSLKLRGLWQSHGAFALFIPDCTNHTAFRGYFQTESLICTYVESSSFFKKRKKEKAVGNSPHYFLIFLFYLQNVMSKDGNEKWWLGEFCILSRWGKKKGKL